MQKITDYIFCIHLQCNTIFKASDWQQLDFSAWQWSQTHWQCSKNIPGLKNTQWNGLASPESRPQHCWSSVESSCQRTEQTAETSNFSMYVCTCFNRSLNRFPIVCPPPLQKKKWLKSFAQWCMCLLISHYFHDAHVEDIIPLWFTPCKRDTVLPLKPA